MVLGSISIAGMSVGELIALISLIAAIVGFVIRWALVAPLRNMIDSLDITLKSLREEMSESKKDRMSLREKQNNHDKEIALLKREDKAIWKYIAEKKIRRRKNNENQLESKNEIKSVLGVSYPANFSFSAAVARMVWSDDTCRYNQQASIGFC